MCTLGDAADVNPVPIKFLRHALQRVSQGSELPEGLMNNPVYFNAIQTESVRRGPLDVCFIFLYMLFNVVLENDGKDQFDRSCEK
jgi:hypothetical protein